MRLEELEKQLEHAKQGDVGSSGASGSSGRSFGDLVEAVGARDGGES